MTKYYIPQAINYCNTLLANKQNAAAYYIRGCAYEKLNQIEKAIQDYSAVLALEPTHINAAYARASCENKIELYQQAIDDYNLAFKSDCITDSIKALQKASRQLVNKVLADKGMPIK